MMGRVARGGHGTYRAKRRRVVATFIVFVMVLAVGDLVAILLLRAGHVRRDRHLVRRRG